VKKLALVLSTFGLLAFATPVFACPHDEGAKDEAPKTAEKDKKQDAPKKKEAPAKKKDDSKQKDTDKVSMK
jgi:hypothetical protein